LYRWDRGRRAASPEIGTFDLASLEKFQTELIEAGFEPAGDGRTWVGPIVESLKELTDASTMEVAINDGWPFRHPSLRVDDLDEWHLSARGDVCLWATGAAGGEWLTWAGFVGRIDQWVQRAKSGFMPEDFALDAHLSFEHTIPDRIATVNLGSLGLDGEGGIGTISAQWDDADRVLEIVRGSNLPIEGRWYYLRNVRVPPRNLEQVRELLAKNQQNNFDRRHGAVTGHGKPELFLLAWDRELGREALVLLAEKWEETVATKAIEIAPTDPEVLKLRAGPDVGALQDRLITVFGIGAVGSNLALRFAEAGLGRLRLVDGDLVRPGNIVRHAAVSFQVGMPKVSAVRSLIRLRAPWTVVVTVTDSPWNPERVYRALEGADLVIDATGLTSFTNLLSVACAERALPLISAALYRGGSLARVRRQALSADKPISDRIGDARYPEIPPGDEPLVFENGCSAPVNNASPIAVSAIAALTAEAAVDYLSGRELYPDEIVEVYRPLEAPPFDKVGRLVR
jgi:hypothetical protein